MLLRERLPSAGSAPLSSVAARAAQPSSVTWVQLRLSTLSFASPPVGGGVNFRLRKRPLDLLPSLQVLAREDPTEVLSAAATSLFIPSIYSALSWQGKLCEEP